MEFYIDEEDLCLFTFAVHKCCAVVWCHHLLSQISMQIFKHLRHTNVRHQVHRFGNQLVPIFKHPMIASYVITANHNVWCHSGGCPDILYLVATPERDRRPKRMSCGLVFATSQLQQQNVLPSSNFSIYFFFYKGSQKPLKASVKTFMTIWFFLFTIFQCNWP